MVEPAAGVALPAHRNLGDAINGPTTQKEWHRLISAPARHREPIPTANSTARHRGRARAGLPPAPRDPANSRARPRGRRARVSPPPPEAPPMSVNVRVAACTHIFRNAGTDGTRRHG